MPAAAFHAVTPTLPTSPAFKEWSTIVDALGTGRQSLILRKGGIAEESGRFAVTAGRFWLFPTHFHAQRDKIKPEAALDSPPENSTTLRFFAVLHAHTFLTDWNRVQALDPFHLWTEATIRERFEWAQPAGLHALVVRVHRLRQPIVFVPGPETAGCKSWIDLPYRFEDYASDPVLDDLAFTRQAAALRASTGTPTPWP